MWNYVDEEGLIENCTVRKKYLNREYKRNELHAHKGYVLRCINDVEYIDEKTGEKYSPIYSKLVLLPISSDIYEYEAISEEKIKNADIK